MHSGMRGRAISEKSVKKRLSKDDILPILGAKNKMFTILIFLFQIFFLVSVHWNYRKVIANQK